MGSNIYSEPEDFGLEILGEAETDESYEFDKFVVWKRKSDGYLLYGTDAGCSCPTPFEDDSLETLEVVDPKNPDAVKSLTQSLESWKKEKLESGYSWLSEATPERLLADIEGYVRGTQSQLGESAAARRES